MLLSASFDGCYEIGVYSLLTNTYCLIGNSQSRTFYSTFEGVLTIPLVECRINSISTIGSQCCGNKNGLLIPRTATASEAQHIRNSLPENVLVESIPEKLNALGNNILCNDRIAIVHPELGQESIQMIERILGTEVICHAIGVEPLVGAYGRLNNAGLLVHPQVTLSECEELASLLDVQVACGTVNRGSNLIAAGLQVNDYVGFIGTSSTVHERAVVETVFRIGESIKTSN